MKPRAKLFLADSGALLGAALLLVQSPAKADPALRVQVDQRGDFVMVGNSLGWDCATPSSEVLVGTADCTDVGNPSDSAQDLYWSSDFPEVGNATASTAVSPSGARSTAMLVLPEGASITYARLYWGGYQAETGIVDEEVVLERPGGSAPLAVRADARWQSFISGSTGDFFYQATAEVTDWVSNQGPGAFRFSGMSVYPMDPETQSHSAVAGWVLVAFYALDDLAPRNLALFDGFDEIAANNPKETRLSGFLVPNAGYDAKLGVLTYEGDSTLTGDQLFFNGVVLSDSVNPGDNFFNGTRSTLGVGEHHAGDLPELSGLAGSLGGLDLDVVDVTEWVESGQTEATIEATSTADRYLLGAFVTSISTFEPSFAGTSKSVTDVTGGRLRPGDVLEYSVRALNRGNDASIDTVVEDLLPAAVEYVPESLAVTVEGQSSEPITDAPGDDAGEYDADSHTIRVRIGAGADALEGGSVPVSGAVTVTFQVVLLDTGDSVVENQATVTAAGELGAASEVFLSDGSGSGVGAEPTRIDVDACATDADCSVEAPGCDLGMTPSECVECVADEHCQDPAQPNCNADTRTCECAAGPGACDDSDGDGLTDRVETELGLLIDDADTDDDGVSDGLEPDPSGDADEDGLINAADFDSDGDGLFDGTELGLGCSTAGVDPSAGHCVADADPSSVSDPLTPDSDGGGLGDGDEDTNGNGRVDAGERDPRDPSDDTRCLNDAECGTLTSGRVCSEGGDCVPGCRAQSGNGCPIGLRCSSSDATIGTCSSPTNEGGAAGASGAAGTPSAAGTAGTAVPEGGSAGKGGFPAGGAGGAGGAAGAAGTAGAAGVAGEGGVPSAAGNAGTSSAGAPHVAGVPKFRGSGLDCSVRGRGVGRIRSGAWLFGALLLLRRGRRFRLFRRAGAAAASAPETAPAAASVAAAGAASATEAAPCSPRLRYESNGNLSC